MVGKNNRGMTAHNGTMFDDRQPIQQAFWQYAAEEAGAAAQSSLAPKASWTKPCAWMPSLRAKQTPTWTSSRQQLAKIGSISWKKRRLRWKTAALSGV